ncbi:bifunctional phosphoribosylaminoimidazolecarboxamide formyltransferase/IMP cyclohydrolase [Terracidiphilus sp.]|jgi:phosphoribosylaminoimidazolecarboxamide formyltransferase/IMP cyclohydrolase|uniref:bifunctional phosphoribosylaminoimidazolecarboxamide formyltransferase/IMP cyclohydrolase n=1 Tax=Terracidiphilus sp. TaxID=1964191 RepID=UPI003C20E36F
MQDCIKEQVLSAKKIHRALLSVTDKSGLVEFAKALAGQGVELISTGGTARTLREAGLDVKDISDLTGFPEMLDGRVKTLHPKVHGGLLYIRGNAEHEAAVAAHGIAPIDMVVVNLYAFEKTAAKPGVAFGHLIENIDIGGPSMVRSAAKNFEDVAIVTRVEDYPTLTEELKSNSGALSRETRWKLAKQAFATTAAYDTAIANKLDRIAESPEPAKPAAPDTNAFPSTLRINYPLAQSLRYGENPHQRAALYADGSGLGVAGAKQLQGKELSYNNLVDLDACWELALELSPEPNDPPAVAIIKHTNPCGAATGATVLEAYQKALSADPVSAFGGVIGINRVVDGAAAEEIAKLFVEAIAAPGFTDEAKERFAAKKNLRLVEIQPAPARPVVKNVSGGLLLQDADTGRIVQSELNIVTKRPPTSRELSALLFAWRVCKHVKSNAIVYACLDGEFAQTVGVGAGQMSRVDAAKFGAMKAVLPLKGTVAASDAFFPFPDGLETVVEAGATAIIQPGGSVKDADVIAAADRLGVAMVFTGIRHFRH